MERVAFLIEETGERVFAMINPAELTLERQSGIRMRQRHERPLACARRSDDPMIYVGGGITDLKLNLLFDVDLLSRTSPSFSRPPDFRTHLQASATEARTPPAASPEGERSVGETAPAGSPGEPLSIKDVRNLSGPLWRLAENYVGDELSDGPPGVHFIWGAAWNLPCIAISIAERFDQFSPDGTPRRSWVRIHLRRTRLPTRPARMPDLSVSRPRATGAGKRAASLPESVLLADPVASSRPDLVCESIYGDMSLLHSLLEFNNIDDFWALELGHTLITPPASVLRGQEQ